jgi:hypothetical protein
MPRVAASRAKSSRPPAKMMRVAVMGSAEGAREDRQKLKLTTAAVDPGLKMERVLVKPV